MAKRFIMWLESAMVQRGLNQAQLAERAGISPSLVSKILSGKAKKTRVGTSDKIAAALEMDAAVVRIAFGIAEGAYFLEDMDVVQFAARYHRLTARQRQMVLGVLELAESLMREEE